MRSLVVLTGPAVSGRKDKAGAPAAAPIPACSTQTIRQLGVLVAFVTSIAQNYVAPRNDDAGRLGEHLGGHSRHDQRPDEGGSQ